MAGWLRQCTIRVTELNGRPEGDYELFEAGGRLQYRGQFHRGRKEGLWTVWDSGGTRIAEIEYADDVRNGPVSLWHGSFYQGGRNAGQLKLDANVLDGRYDGEYRTYFASGGLRSFVVFSKGEIVSADLYDEQGEVAVSGGPVAFDQARGDVSRDLSLFATIEESIRYSLSYASRQE